MNPVNPTNKDVVISGNNVSIFGNTIDIGNSNTTLVNVTGDTIDIGSSSANSSTINIGNPSKPINISSYINQLGFL